MAKELHYGLDGLLSTIKLSLSQASREKKDDRDPAFTLIDTAHNELRRIAYNLMPGTLLKYGLVASLEEM